MGNQATRQLQVARQIDNLPDIPQIRRMEERIMAKLNSMHNAIGHTRFEPNYSRDDNLLDALDNTEEMVSRVREKVDPEWAAQGARMQEENAIRRQEMEQERAAALAAAALADERLQSSSR